MRASTSRPTATTRTVNWDGLFPEGSDARHIAGVLLPQLDATRTVHRPGGLLHRRTTGSGSEPTGIPPTRQTTQPLEGNGPLRARRHPDHLRSALRDQLQRGPGATSTPMDGDSPGHLLLEQPEPAGHPAHMALDRRMRRNSAGSRIWTGMMPIMEAPA